MTVQGAVEEYNHHAYLRAAVEQPRSLPSTPVLSDHTPVSYHSFSTDKPFDVHPRERVSRGQKIRDELVRLTSMAGPLFLQNIFSYSTSIIAVAFVGHLGDPLSLSSAVLANSLYNVTGYSLISGLSAGMETLCGQAYGARSYKTLGLVLQRALLITWLTCLPIMLLWAHSEGLMLALGQQPAIAKGAAKYLWNITPTLFMGAIVECVKRYLLAQQVVLPGMVVTVITACLSPLYNWLLIFRYRLELMGAAYAFVLSQGTSCLLLLAYTIWRDVRMCTTADEAATWSRPSIAVFQGWGKYLSYGAPAAAMICMEWWCYEVVIFMAGLSHNAEVAVGVMGLMFQISALAYMSAMAYGSSVNTRVSNELGAGRADAAKLAVNTAVAVVAVVQTAWAVACWLAAWQVVGVLSSNKEVVKETVEALPILLPTFVGDAINCLAQGVLRGAGRPGLGAILNIVGYWVFGVPLAWFFGLHMSLSVKGFWLALMITSSGQCIVQMCVISRFDWQREVERAAALNAEHHEEWADKLASDLDHAVSRKHLHTHPQQQQQHDQDRLSDLQRDSISVGSDSHVQEGVLQVNSSSDVAVESEHVSLLGRNRRAKQYQPSRLGRAWRQQQRDQEQLQQQQQQQQQCQQWVQGGAEDAEVVVGGSSSESTPRGWWHAMPG